MAGGGLRLASMVEVLERTGLRWLHGSLTRRAGERLPESFLKDAAADGGPKSWRPTCARQCGCCTAILPWKQVRLPESLKPAQARIMRIPCCSKGASALAVAPVSVIRMLISLAGQINAGPTLPNLLLSAATITCLACLSILR